MIVPACPKCGAAAGRHPCKRPSGHEAAAMHAERRELLTAQLRASGAPEGDYEIEAGRAVLVRPYPTEAEWNAMSDDARAAWWGTEPSVTGNESEQLSLC